MSLEFTQVENPTTCETSTCKASFLRPRVFKLAPKINTSESKRQSVDKQRLPSDEGLLKAFTLIAIQFRLQSKESLFEEFREK